MAVAIFPSLEGESLEDYSIRLAERWRIGQKGLDNGVILLVFVQERRVRLEVGYGLEPVLPDALAARIVREAVAPSFREGRYAAGIEAAAAAVFARVETRAAPGARRRGGTGFPSWSLLGFFAVFGVLVLLLLREAMSAQRFVRGNAYTASRRGWSTPVIFPAPWTGGSGWGGGGSGGGGFSGGGGEFGGGGASGEW